MDYALNYVDKTPGYFKNLKTCNIGEEFFFHNIIMNSPYRNTVKNESLFYNKWSQGGVAEFLTEEDYKAIMEGNHLFARKFGKGSEELARHICKTIGEESVM